MLNSAAAPMIVPILPPVIMSVAMTSVNSVMAVWIPGDGRADIFRHGRDRDVHHRRVEDHQELRRPEDQQHAARSSCGRLRRAATGVLFHRTFSH